MAFIINIEGTDGCGKQTQSRLLYDELTQKGFDCEVLSFPQYDSPSSAPVKMYLGGEFGESAASLDAYQASTLFAVDRLCTMVKIFKKEQNKIYILDRYVPSNMIHQACKINDKEERSRFLEWINEFEFGTLKLPKPNLILFLDMPVEASQRLANARAELKAGTKKDIHENDKGHLQAAYNAGIDVCEKFGWIKVNCTMGAEIKSIEAIHKEIMDSVYNLLKNAQKD